MNRRKRAFVNFVSGGAGYVIPMIINLVTTPLILQGLGEEAYGLSVITNVIVGYLIVADMGLDIPVTLKAAELRAKDNKEVLSRFISTTFKMYLLIGLVGCTALCVLSGKLVDLFTIPPSLRDEAQVVFYLSGIGFIGSVLNMWGRALFNGFQSYEIANGLAIVSNVAGIFVGLLMIYFGFGVVGFLSARFGSFILVAFCYALLAFRKTSSFKLFPFVDSKIWKSLKTNVGNGIVIRLSGMIFSRMDQTLIGVWLGMAFVTIYSIPFLIVTTLSGLISSLTHFAFPMVTSILAIDENSDITDFYLRITKLITILSTLFFLPFLILGDKIIAIWLNTQIANDGSDVFKLLLIAFYFNSCLTIGMNAFLGGKGRIRFFAVYTVIRGLVLLISSFILIRPIGLEGAGIAYLIVLFIDIGAVLIATKKVLQINLMVIIINCYLKPMLLGGVLCAILWFMRDNITTLFDIVFYGGLYGLVYLIISFFAGIFDPYEREMVYSVIGKLLSR